MFINEMIVLVIPCFYFINLIEYYLNIVKLLWLFNHKK